MQSRTRNRCCPIFGKSPGYESFIFISSVFNFQFLVPFIMFWSILLGIFNFQSFTFRLREPKQTDREFAAKSIFEFFFCSLRKFRFIERNQNNKLDPIQHFAPKSAVERFYCFLLNLRTFEFYQNNKLDADRG